MTGINTPFENNAEYADFALYRSQMYAAASAAFTTEPTCEELQALVEAACASDGSDCLRDCELNLFEHLQTYRDEDPSELRTRVATEYAELFVGPRPPLAPLYESVYVGAVKRLNTDVTMQVRRFYENHGLTAVNRNRVPNDHIGFELEFMARLCALEAEAAMRDDHAECDRLRHVQLEFLALHLSAWVDLFASRLSQAWCADYYDAWARFVQSFIKEDDAYLSASLGIAA
jgi:DMSO reductase family type II enzyme chaperone